MKKGWIFACLFAAFALIALASGGRDTVKADGEHVHCVCGGSASAAASDQHSCDDPDQVWTPISDEAGLRALTGKENYVYLTGDVVLTQAYKIVSGIHVNLCLNGHSITAAKNAKLLWFGDNADVILSITDCQKTGRLLSNPETTGVANGGVLYLGTGARASFYEITIEGGKSTTCGGNIWINGIGSSGVKFFHCTIKGGAAMRSEDGKSAQGGNLFVGNSSAAGDLWLIDTTLSGGVAHHLGTASGSYASGGNAYIRCSGTVQKAHFVGATVITGGTASSEKMYTSGGNIHLTAGTAEVGAGVTISGGTSRSDAGNFMIGTGANVTVNGATITGGTGATGGSITVEKGTLTIRGTTTVSGGRATSKGGNLYVKGDGASVTIEDGIIEKGEMTSSSGSYGGNVAVDAGTVTITGGTIRDGKVANANGYNLSVGYSGTSTKGTVVIRGGTIGGALSGTKGNSVCTQANSANPVYSGTLEIYGGTFGEAVQSVGGSLTISGGTFATVAAHTGALTVNGGTFDLINANGANANADADVIVNGGYAGSLIRDRSANNAVTVAINGGFFVSAPDEIYLGTGKHLFAGSYTNPDAGDTKTYAYEVAEGYLIESTARRQGDLSRPFQDEYVGGGGVYRKDEVFTLSIPVEDGMPVSGDRFIGWYDAEDLTVCISDSARFGIPATKDAVYYALYEPVPTSTCTLKVTGGAYTYRLSYDGPEETGTDAGITASAGAMVTLIYAGEEPLGAWVNESGKLLSRDQKISLQLMRDMEVRLIAKPTSEAVAVFYNKSHQVLRSFPLSELTDADIPAVPSVTGFSGGVWKAGGKTIGTADEIRSALQEGSSVVEVMAAYESASSTYTVTIKGVMLGEEGTLPSSWERYDYVDTSFTAEIGSPIKLDLKRPATSLPFDFLGYADENGDRLTYYLASFIRFDHDTQIYAVFGDPELLREAGGKWNSGSSCIRFVTKEKAGNEVRLEALRFIWPGHLIQEQGILFTNEAGLGGRPAEEVLQEDNTSVYRYVSNGRYFADVTGLTLKNVDEKIYARAYVVLGGVASTNVVYSEIAEIAP